MYQKNNVSIKRQQKEEVVNENIFYKNKLKLTRKNSSNLVADNIWKNAKNSICDGVMRKNQ